MIYSAAIPCFLESAREQNISRAAKKLYISPQAVSKHILRLEQELDCQLFLRMNNQLTLTPEGRLYYACFTDMIIGGSVIIEQIFNIQGMGARLVTAIGNRDYSMILGITIVISVFTMVIMLLVDLVYAAVDPRIKAEFSAGSKKKTKKAKSAEGGVA